MIRILALFFPLLIAAVAAQEPAFREFRRWCRNQSRLICVLSPASGSNVSGRVIFRAVFRLEDKKPKCFVRISAKVTGLTGPRHGFHIHEFGDISDSSGASTGGHFLNPAGTPVEHGLPFDDVRHWGDFGNLRPIDGVAKYNRVDRVISIPGIVGRGITVHAGRDMGAAEQPSGASGPRIGFCVIGFANPSSVVV